MKTSRTSLFQLYLTLVVCTDSSTCMPLSNDIQNEDPEKLFHQLSAGLLEEEDAEWRVEKFLGTMKEGFLRQLNLSDVPQEHSKISPPQFMVELYNKYATDNSVTPQFDVLRSFMVQDMFPSTFNGTKSKHRLRFNVSIPSHEKITTAELQLFLIPDARSKITSQTFKATLKVYEADGKNFTSSTQLLDGREVVVSQSTWVTFDVTTAVQSWIKSGQGISFIDVEVDRKDCGGEEDARCLNMSMSVGDNSSAALIVFSDDFGNRRRETRKELKEMILHEEETLLHMGADVSRGNQLLRESPDSRHLRRMKRKADMEYCRRTSLKVNFKDIGWDKWIVAPSEYDAYECRGLCSFPLTNESTPSKHALIQTLMNLRDSEKVNMACCVPIKLDPITVMYQENGRLIIRYLYEDMKVAACGCR